MKRYTSAAGALLFASALFLFLALKSVEHARGISADLAEASRTVKSGQDLLRISQRAADAAKRSGAPVDAFLGGWNAEIEAEGNIEQVFGRLDTLAVDNLLSPSGKNFGSRTNYLFQGRKMPVQTVNITVAGDYYRTLNWLGAVESAFPLARVEQISYMATGNSLSLALQLVFPRKFDLE